MTRKKKRVLECVAVVLIISGVFVKGQMLVKPQERLPLWFFDYGTLISYVLVAASISIVIWIVWSGWGIDD